MRVWGVPRLNELNLEGRLNKHNPSPLFPYFVTLIYDCVSVQSTTCSPTTPISAAEFAKIFYRIVGFLDSAETFYVQVCETSNANGIMRPVDLSSSCSS